MILSPTRAVVMVLLVLAVGLLLTGPVRATTFNYDFSGSNVVVPSSQTFTSNGVSITANGYSVPDTAGFNVIAGTSVDMYEKDGGLGERGLGISPDVTGDDTGEIVTVPGDDDNPGTIYDDQLNLTNLISHGVSSVVVTVESVQSGESFQFWDSSTAGTLGTAIGSATSGGDPSCSGVICTETISLSASTPYLGLTAPMGDVVLHTLAGTSVAPNPVPEPASLVLLGSGLAGLAGWQSWRRMKRA